MKLKNRILSVITPLFFLFIFGVICFRLNAQNVYVDGGNLSGNENGTKQNPFNTIEKGINKSKTGDTIIVKKGIYLPLGGELFLKPGTVLFGENPENTIINADIIDTAQSELPIEIHNLTFGEFYCSRGTNCTANFSKPCLIKNNICKNVSICHGGGYIENGDDYTFKPIPFFHIEDNTVSGEISFNHNKGKMVGMNILRNNTAAKISLNHGTVTVRLIQTEPGCGYLIEENTVVDEISFRQGASLDSTLTDIIKNNTQIIVKNNHAGIIEINSGAGHTYYIDKNTIQKGIKDSSGACWTTISNNIIINGRIVDASGGTGKLDCYEPSCMVEDEIIESNTIYFEATGDPTNDVAIIASSRSVTIRNNKITCKGAASGMKLSSASPTHVIGNIISVEPFADFGINTFAGYGVVTNNKITGGKIGYSSTSGAVLFENNTIHGSHWGFYSRGKENVKNNTITNCTGHGMVLIGLRGPISGNTVTNNDSTGIWVIREVDLGGGVQNGMGKNIIRGNGFYDLRISINAETPDTLFINNNVWEHETTEDILKYDILNESTGGKLQLDFNSIIAKPSVVKLASPDNLAVLNKLPAQMVWQTLESVDAYRLQISSDEVFGTIVLDTLLTAVTYSIQDLPDKSDFHWRVQAVNVAGEGDWSETRKLSTIITGLQETEIGKDEIVFYPNPTNGIFRICLTDKVGHVEGLKFNVQSVEVVDLNGKILENFILLAEPGSQEYDIRHLKPGIYLCRIKTDNSVFISKLFLR
jgi:hypothetical protein